MQPARLHRLLSVLPVAALLICASLLIGSCSREGKETEAGGAGITWVTSFDEALEIARSKNRPIMIDFYTDWCGWCKTLDNTTYSHAAVVAKANDFVSAKIDADAQRAVAARYRVGAFPTILFVDPGGRELHRVIGFRPPEDFLKEMDAALTSFRKQT